MREIGERAKLALEARDRLGLASAQDFQRDGGVVLAIVDLVDDAERAVSQAP